MTDFAALSHAELVARCEAYEAMLGQPPGRAEWPVVLRGHRFTPAESRLLRLIVAERCRTKATLTMAYEAAGFDVQANVLEVLVWRMRRALNERGYARPLETMRGYGWRASDEVRADVRAHDAALSERAA